MSAAETVGDAANFLLESQDAVVATHEGAPLYVELPAAVELTIEYTEPGMQGDRSTGGTKPAKLETGYEIAVPLFITSGEKVKVDTRTGDLPRPGHVVTHPRAGLPQVTARSKARKRALDVVVIDEDLGRMVPRSRSLPMRALWSSTS